MRAAIIEGVVEEVKIFGKNTNFMSGKRQTKPQTCANVARSANGALPEMGARVLRDAKV
jgi:hypothetical protein